VSSATDARADVRPTVRVVDVVVSSPTPHPAPPRPPLAVRVRRIADLSVIGVFFVGLSVVWFGTFAREQPPLDENRDRYPPPPLALKKHVLQDYPKWFEMYFGDRVGFRDVLLAWHHHTSYRVFDDPVSKFAWIGRDGWLFLNVDDTKAKQCSLADRLTAWADALADRRAYLNARGIGYVVMVTPDKSSVYPEFLRGHAARQPPPEPAAALGELLAARGVRYANPLPELLAAKDTYPVYYKLDSHWTYDGARIGYRLLANELARTRPEFRPLPDDAIEAFDESIVGDLGKLVGVHGPDSMEPARRLQPVSRNSRQNDTPTWSAALPPEAKPRHLPPREFTCDAATGPAVVLFRDSFGEQLLPFVRADFRTAAVVSSAGLEMPVIDAVRPAVVVQQIVARKLYLELPTNPPEVAGFGRR
jgi:hypothetical protein